MLEDKVFIAEKLGKLFEKNQNSVQIGHLMILLDKNDQLRVTSNQAEA